jgi:hypothetical protein
MPPVRELLVQLFSLPGRDPPLRPPEQVPLEMHRTVTCQYTLLCWCPCEACRHEIHHCGHSLNCHVRCPGE